MLYSEDPAGPQGRSPYEQPFVTDENRFTGGGNVGKEDQPLQTYCVRLQVDGNLVTDDNGFFSGLVGTLGTAHMLLPPTLGPVVRCRVVFILKNNDNIKIIFHVFILHRTGDRAKTMTTDEAARVLSLYQNNTLYFFVGTKLVKKHSQCYKNTLEYS